MKKVSIVIPAYNSENFIREAIESALDQTWKNKEVIVVDDGSTDATYRIARSFNSKGVKVMQQSNKGACAARNRGIRHAKGDFIQLLDSDDILLPEKIERQLEYQKSSSTLTFCNTSHFFGETRNVLKNSFKYPEMLALKDLISRYYVFTPSVLLPGKIFREFGNYNEQLKRAQEHEFHVRLAAAGFNFFNLDFNGVMVRHHNSRDRISNKSVRGTSNNDILLLKLIESHIESFTKLNAGTSTLLYNELVNLAIYKAQQHGNLGCFEAVKEIDKFVGRLAIEKKFNPSYRYKSGMMYNQLIKLLGLPYFEMLRYYFLTKPKSIFANR